LPRWRSFVIRVTTKDSARVLSYAVPTLSIDSTDPSFSSLSCRRAKRCTALHYPSGTRARSGLAARDRHMQSIHHEFGPQVCGHRLADHLAAAGIEDEGQAHEVLLSRSFMNQGCFRLTHTVTRSNGSLGSRETALMIVKKR
jgi:hypothetical protein